MVTGYNVSSLLPTGRNRYEKQRVASSPVRDTARQSTHRRKGRLVIRVDDGLGGRPLLHELDQGGVGRRWSMSRS